MSPDLADLPFKNPYALSGSWLHIVLPNAYPTPVTFVANASDAELLAPHRWRLIQDKVVTVVTGSDGGYLTCSAANIILRQPRTVSIENVNGDPLDLRRVNLSKPSVRSTQVPSTITAHGQVAHIHLKDGLVAIVDREDLPHVSGFSWIVVGKEREQGERLYVQALVRPEDGSRKTTVLLQRHVLRLPVGDRTKIHFADGDRLNFRKANLLVEDD